MSPLSSGRPILVVGYGNTLRSDDAVGFLVAQAVASWSRAGVNSVAVNQLTPELAQPLSESSVAIFVDSRCDLPSDGVLVHPLEPVRPALGIGHTSDPRFLLALSRAVYGGCPRAWLLTVPAADFAIGQSLSPVAQRGLQAALDLLANWLDRLSSPTLPFPRVVDSDPCMLSA